jgi:hypothetical protein
MYGVEYIDIKPVNGGHRGLRIIVFMHQIGAPNTAANA